MSVYLNSGAVILQDDKVATSDNCCCGVTGACCLDGECTIKTQSDCEDSGGTFQGDGTDCDITGACCKDGNCSVTTQACCEDNGGEYKGDNTTCDPNPCDCCGFLGFLGGGRYLTAQMHCEGTYDVSGSSSTSSWTADATTVIDPDTCDVICADFSGSGEVTKTGGVGGPCSGNFVASSCHATTCTCSGNCAFSLPTVSSVPYGTGGYLQWDYSGDPLCENLWGCTNFNWSPFSTFTIFSDTVAQYIWNGTGPGGSSWSVTETLTLSDPCTPI